MRAIYNDMNEAIHDMFTLWDKAELRNIDLPYIHKIVFANTFKNELTIAHTSFTVQPFKYRIRTYPILGLKSIVGDYYFRKERYAYNGFEHFFKLFSEIELGDAPSKYIQLVKIPYSFCKFIFVSNVESARDETIITGAPTFRTFDNFDLNTDNEELAISHGLNYDFAFLDKELP